MHLAREILPFEIVNGSVVQVSTNYTDLEGVSVSGVNGTSWFFHLSRLLTPCYHLKEPEHVLFQLANGCFLMSSLATDSPPGVLTTHALLMIGYLLYSTWAWNIICAPDIFSWTFAFTLLNMCHVVHSLYRLRPVSFSPELEPLFRHLFHPLGISRMTFKKLVSSEYAQFITLHAGEAYALQNITRADRLSLLLTGKAEAISDRMVLHAIESYEFLDSPEYESSPGAKREKFRVSIIAITACRCITWQRSSLEYLLVKEPHLATVFGLLVARDVTSKIYQMNKKLAFQKGILLDIRLPGVIDSSFYKKMDKDRDGSIIESNENIGSLEKIIPHHSRKENGKAGEMF